MLTSTRCHFKGGQHLITVRLWYYAKLRDSRTHCRTTTRGGGGGYSGFQVTGMIEGLFGFEIFDFGIFLSRKILASIFWGSLIQVEMFLGTHNNLKIHDRYISFNVFWKFLWLGNWAWDFWGFCLKPQGFFWALIFAPIRSSLSLEIQSTPCLPREQLTGTASEIIPQAKPVITRPA